MREWLKEAPICAILRNVPQEVLREYAEAIFRGGIRMFEIAMNSENGAEQIESLKRQFENRPEVKIGAGTVTTMARCQEAELAGADFFLTPSVSEKTLDYCRNKKIPLLPGVMTPSDVAVCLEYGYTVMKLFPAGDLPDGYIHSLKGPFDKTDYVAVGGVNRNNIRRFFHQGFIGVGVGSSLIPPKYVKEKSWIQAEEYVRELLLSASPS